MYKVRSILVNSQNYESAKELVTKGIPDFANIYHSQIEKALQETSVKGLLEHVNEERSLIESSVRDDVTIDNCENLAKELMYGYIKEDKFEKLENLFKELVNHYPATEIRSSLKAFLTSKFTDKEDQAGSIPPSSPVSSSTSSTPIHSSTSALTNESSSRPASTDQNQAEANLALRRFNPVRNFERTQNNTGTLRGMFCLNSSCCKSRRNIKKSEAGAY